MDVRNVVASYRAFCPVNGAWRRRALNLEKRISGRHFECKENSTAVVLSLARRKMSRKQGSASVTGLTHENEMFPKIKKGRSRRGRERERNVLNRLEYKETAGLSVLPSPPPRLPKAIGFIPKHVELEATNRLCKHPLTLSEMPPFGNKNMKKRGNKDGSEESVEQPCKSVTVCMLSAMFTTTTEQIVL